MAAQPRLKVKDQWAKEIAGSTPERTFLDHCLGRGILGRERLPSIEASATKHGIGPLEAKVRR